MRGFISFPNENSFQGFVSDHNGKALVECRGFEDEALVSERVHLAQAQLNPEPRRNFSFQFLETTSQTDYQEMVERCVSKIRANQAKKVVLSRPIKFLYVSSFPLQKTLLALRSKYPGAYVFSYQNKGAIWLGASPETFIKKSVNTVTSFALAATRKWQNEYAVDWNKKEKEEQALVENYILEGFKSEGITKIKTDGPKTHRAGNLAHILSSITGELSDNSQFEHLKNILFPTPAVNGFPRNKALELIREVELHKRELYGGYLGIGTTNEFDSWVNLRCMKIEENTFTIYVGGGIVEGSDPEQEWQETEEKSKTLLSVLSSIVGDDK